MKEINYKIVGQRLEYARNQKEISLEDAGQYIGVHKSTILRWENGSTKKIALPILESLANFYNVSPAWLVGLDVPMEKQSEELEDKLLKLNNYMEENNINSIKLIPIFDNINLNNNWKKHPTGYTPFDAKIQGCPENRDYFYYKISENSMNIEKDTYVLIENTNNIDINDIILYSIDNKNIELGIYKLNLKQEKKFIVLGKYIK